MRTTRLGFSPADLIPEALRAFLVRRAAEVTGLFLMALSIGCAVSLATWSVRDPSINHATDAPVRNALGFPGAIVSDLLMQMFGLGAVVTLGVMALWGWKLVGGHSCDRIRMRLIACVIGSSAACALCSAMPETGRWPLPTGLGGVFGDALFDCLR